MQIIEWKSLDASGRLAALARPPALTSAAVIEQARAIVANVRSAGDTALARYALQFDGAALTQLRVSAAEFAQARTALPDAALQALRTAIANITAFHQAQVPADFSMETQPGVRCERLVRPTQAVGLYVPAGSAPLPSTAIMLAVPAQRARCPRRVMCTPARPDGRADPAVLVAEQLCGIDLVFKVGGAQAVAAMAYGTASVPKVAKIFGPGNRWVAAAKQLVAADLLAQAEHDPGAQALLVTTSGTLAERVAVNIRQRVPMLSRRAILEKSLQTLRLIVVPDLNTAVNIAEQYAPEHLLIETQHPRELLAAITTAGSVFLGRWSPEPVGDYCSGTNHVLPTFGYARAYSGLSVADFVRSMTVQELSGAGLAALGPVAATLARLEGLDAHAAAVEVRLQVLRT